MSETSGEGFNNVPEIGNDPNKPLSLERPRGETFRDLQWRIEDPALPENERNQLLSQRNGLVRQAINETRGEIFQDAQVSLPQILAGTHWDRVYTELSAQGRNLEGSARRYYAGRPEWEGMVETLVEGARANVILSGIEQKQEQTGQIGQDWLDRKGYRGEVVDKLQKDVRYKYFYDLVGPTPQFLVGTNFSRSGGQRYGIEDIGQHMTNTAEQLALEMNDLFPSDPDSPGNPSEPMAGPLYRAYLQGLADRTAQARSEFDTLDLWEDMKRWIDMEYRQQFYTAFTPNQEPRFYMAGITGAESRASWEVRWQVARAVYVKNALASYPEKYIENRDLNTLTREQVEVLYNIPGVKPVWESFARKIVNKEPLREPVQAEDAKGQLLFDDSGNPIMIRTIYDVKDVNDFNLFRTKLVHEVVENDPDFFQYYRYMCGVRANLLRKERLTESEYQDVYETLIKERAAIGWNTFSMFLQLESSSSYYSDAGEFAQFPTVVASVDFKGAMHPQERYFWKMFVGQAWGRFSLWGQTQMERVLKKSKFDSKEDEIRYAPAPKVRNYWTFKRLNERPSNPNKHGKVIEVYAPECHPVTTSGSFFEETSVGGKTILQTLIDGEQIDWREVSSDAVAIWLFGKFNKGVQLVEYFNPGKSIENKPDGTLEWASKANEILRVRLRLGKVIDNLRKKDPKKGEHRTYQTEENLRRWMIYAAYGGVDSGHIGSRAPVFPADMHEKGVIDATMRKQSVRFLKRRWRWGNSLEIKDS